MFVLGRLVTACSDLMNALIARGYSAIVCRFSSRFGYEYFDKLSSRTIKDLFTEDVANAGISASLEEADNDDLGVITLGVNEVWGNSKHVLYLNSIFPTEEISGTRTRGDVAGQSLWLRADAYEYMA